VSLLGQFLEALLLPAVAGLPVAVLLSLANPHRLLSQAEASHASSIPKQIYVVELTRELYGNL
jgi:hypothetical protein